MRHSTLSFSTLFSILIWGVKFKKIVVLGPAHHRETFSRIKYLGAVEVGDSTLMREPMLPGLVAIVAQLVRLLEPSTR
jgi:hypothetical protein